MREQLSRGGIAALIVVTVALSATAPAAASSGGSVASGSSELPSFGVGGVDLLSCTARVGLADTIANVTTEAWSPDSSAIAFVHTVNVPSRTTVTGYEEDQRVATLNVATGAVRELGHGSKPSWSASGALLAYWDDDGSIHVLLSGEIVAELDASEPGLGWNGDSLLFWKGAEIRAWSAGAIRTVATVDPMFAPHYPSDDAYFSADGSQFTIARYANGGTGELFVGTTATGEIAPIGDGNTTFSEWSPRGATLLLRSATALSLRAADGTVQNAALSSFGGTVHGWTADGRLFVGAMSATIPGGNAFDRFAVWGGDPGVVTTIPNLLGARAFSPDGRWFTGVSRTDLYTDQLELYRCGAATGVAGGLRAETTSRSRAQKIAAEGNRFVRPVAGAFTQYVQGTHTGIDISAPVGSIIVASDDGVVDAVGLVAVGGFRVCVSHAGGLESCDYHTSLPLVRIGEHVARGQPVALVGLTGQTTGPHVHWEAKRDGRIVNPLDQ